MAQDSQKNDSKVEQRLEVVEKAIKEIDQLHRKQLFVNLCGFVLVVLVIGLFILNLISFARNYNTKALLNELAMNTSTVISENEEVHKLVGDLRAVFIPALREELVAGINAEMPNIRKQFESSMHSVNEYLKKDLRNRLLQRLTKNLEDIEKDLIKRYPKYSAIKMQKTFDEVNKQFLAEITKRLEKRLDRATKELSKVHATVESLKKTPEYKAMSPADKELIKNKLIESLLEIWIYHLNPERGDKKAGV